MKAALFIATYIGLATATAATASTLQMQSAFPGTLPQFGTLAQSVAADIGLVTDGEFEVHFNEPGAIVPALEVFDAVASGAVEMGWSTPGFWAGKVPSLQIFSSVPFGPEPAEYIAWMRHGGGREMMEDIYEQNNIYSLHCGLIAPEASGWFRKEIVTVDDLKGLKMRFFGLGAKVMERLGVSTQLLSVGDVFPALERGAIDAAEIATPAIDRNLGLYQVAKYYYFPGWHQQASFLELMINLDTWRSMDESTQRKINVVCEAAMTQSLAEGESLQMQALEFIESEGVNIRQWSPEILITLEETWNSVVEEEVLSDANFAKAWLSLTEFRKRYATWQALGYLEN